MKTVSVFSYSELSPEAQKKAREWYAQNLDFDPAIVIDDACEIGAILGLDMRQTLKTRRDGSHYHAASVFYRGFWSQGDGASFQAEYRYNKNAPKLIAEHAPNDAELLRIAKTLQSIQKRFFYKLQATIKQRGHYCHEYTMFISELVDSESSRDVSPAESELIECFQDFAKWIYKRLESDYCDQTSDETIAETLKESDFLFFQNGSVCHAAKC